MTLMKWGRGLLVWGLVAALLSIAPELLLGLAPGLRRGFLGVLALLLSFSVTPLALVVASAGAILLLVAVLRRDRF